MGNNASSLEMNAHAEIRRAGGDRHSNLATTVQDTRYDFTGSHSPQRQRFEMSSTLTMKAPNGQPAAVTVYRLILDCDPGTIVVGDRYTCRSVSVQHDNQTPASVPSLAGWNYLFRHRSGERDGAGRTLGIDHAPFEHLVDANGTALSELDSYHVYNAFIDFHSFQIFTDPTSAGAGIQNLQEVGSRIVHAASHSRPDTDLGEKVGAGSWFENGEVTLEFIGVGRSGDRACAIIAVDSGASSFRMLMKPMPQVEVRTEGGSHYWATIYKDLETMWIRRANLTELVVSETLIPGNAEPVRGVAERSIVVTNVTDAA